MNPAVCRLCAVDNFVKYKIWQIFSVVAGMIYAFWLQLKKYLFLCIFQRANRYALYVHTTLLGSIYFTIKVQRLLVNWRNICTNRCCFISDAIQNLPPIVTQQACTVLYGQKLVVCCSNQLMSRSTFGI